MAGTSSAMTENAAGGWLGDNMRIALSVKENKARNLLIEVAKGAIDDTCSPGLIGYKDFWERCSSERWTRANNKAIVSLVTKISGYEIQHDRPMLNELVINVSGKKKWLPGVPLNNISHYLRDTFDVRLPPYKTHVEAQRACWEYWRRKVAQETTVAEEGEPDDRTVPFRKRNEKIIQLCKDRDNYRCRACNFRLKIGNTYIIDCHHKYPLGNNPGIVITNLDDLMCLCPTCHRIAHTRRLLPLDIEEIRGARKLIK
jgi:hypothetical protein